MGRQVRRWCEIHKKQPPPPPLQSRQLESESQQSPPSQLQMTTRTPDRMMFSSPPSLPLDEDVRWVESGPKPGVSGGGGEEEYCEGFGRYWLRQGILRTVVGPIDRMKCIMECQAELVRGESYNTKKRRRNGMGGGGGGGGGSTRGGGGGGFSFTSSSCMASEVERVMGQRGGPPVSTVTTSASSASSSLFPLHEGGVSRSTRSTTTSPLPHSPSLSCPFRSPFMRGDVGGGGWGGGGRRPSPLDIPPLPFSSSAAVFRHICQHEGARKGLWRGHTIQLSSIVAQSLAFHHFSETGMRLTYTVLAPQSEMGELTTTYVGMLFTGFLCSVIPYPLELLRLHVALDVKGLWGRGAGGGGAGGGGGCCSGGISSLSYSLVSSGHSPHNAHHNPCSGGNHNNHNSSRFCGDVREAGSPSGSSNNKTMMRKMSKISPMEDSKINFRDGLLVGQGNGGRMGGGAPSASSLRLFLQRYWSSCKTWNYLSGNPVLRDAPSYYFTGAPLHLVGTVVYHICYQVTTLMLEGWWWNHSPEGMMYNASEAERGGRTMTSPTSRSHIIHSNTNCSRTTSTTSGNGSSTSLLPLLPWSSILGSVMVDVFATMVATAVAHPFDLIRRRRMLAVLHDQTRYRTSLECAHQIMTVEGIRGFYRGLPISLGRMLALAGLFQGIGFAEGELARRRYHGGGMY